MFYTLADGLSTVKKYCQVDDTSNDQLILQFLDSSKAFEKVTNKIVYRPWITAYKFLAVNPLNGGIVSMIGTDTITFDSPQKLLDGLLELQKTLDRALYGIPIGWESIPFNQINKFSAFIV